MCKKNVPTENLKWKYESEQIPSLFKDGKYRLFSPSQTKRVLVIGDGSLFDDGIIYLLNYQPNLILTHAKYQDDVSILHAVEQNQADILILAWVGPMNLKYILGMLMSVQTSAQIRLVVLRLETNQIEIYERDNSTNVINTKHITVVKAEDFLFALSNKLE